MEPPKIGKTAPGNAVHAIRNLLQVFTGSFRDLVPIILVIAFFQIVVLRQPFPDLERVLVGLVFVIVGLSLFVQGLATTIPGRSPLIDGFGLIAFASLFPIMSVMGYATLTDWLRRRGGGRSREKEP